MRLYESGCLSFDPERVSEMDESQDIEFRFLGALAAAGCDDHMFKILLKSLHKPYLYSLNRIYFDWQCGGRWLYLPRRDDFKDETPADWIGSFKDEGDTDALREICDLATEALEELAKEEYPKLAADPPRPVAGPD